MNTTTDVLPTAMTSNVLTTGLLGIVLVLMIAALCIFPFTTHFFIDWVAMAFMAATPTQIILTSLWENKKPQFINCLPVPLKGISLTLITVLASIIVFKGILYFISGDHGITPMVIQYTIISVIITLWIIPIWECWPFNKVSDNPTTFGLLVLVSVYPIAYLIWSVFFDYSHLGEIGFINYYEDIDPKGIFDMWQALTFAVTTSGVVIVHTLFDFWPINKICGRSIQPLRGIISSIYVLLLSWGVYSFFVTFLGMDQVDYMIRVPVCMIFGSLLINNMMQGSLFSGIAQPIRGSLLMACCVFSALLMHQLYAFASTLHAGYELGTGAKNGFAQEIWIASAMLGVTFPIIFVVSGFFNFWPIQRNK